MDRWALHSHGIAAGSRARRESGPGARQRRSSVRCWCWASSALGRLPAPLSVLLQACTRALGFLAATWCRGALGCCLQRGTYGEDRLSLASTSTPWQHWGPPQGHQCLLAKASWWPCFYLPRREKRSRITVALIAHQLQALAMMLLLSLLSCRMWDRICQKRQYCLLIRSSNLLASHLTSNYVPRLHSLPLILSWPR